MSVRELDLDLDAFEGPFDLLLTLVLREEVPLAEVDVAGIVVAFIERLAEREELDLDACGEFLVLVASLLELKARGLFGDEDGEFDELAPEEAAEELARRLEEYRRIKEAALWLAERLAGERDRFFRLGPAPLAPPLERRLAPQDPALLAASLRALAAEPPQVSLSTSSFASRRSRSFWSVSVLCSSAVRGSISTVRSRVCRGSSRRSRSSRCSTCAGPGRSRSTRRVRSLRSGSRGRKPRGSEESEVPWTARSA